MQHLITLTILYHLGFCHSAPVRRKFAETLMSVLIYYKTKNGCPDEVWLFKELS